MDFFGDFGLYVVRALALLARWLSAATAPVPWPVVTALVAIPALAVVTFIVWFLRGAVWPVRCKHPATTVRARGDNECRTMVAGEWRRCRHHNKRRHNSRGQFVDPDMPRWKTIVSGRVVDRTDSRGAGRRVSLLFCRGYARKPAQVWEAFPTIWDEWCENVQVAFTRLRRRSVTPSSVSPPTAGTGPTLDEQERYRSVHVRAVRADQALTALRFLLPSALLAAAASAFVPEAWAVPVEYVALLLLWVVVEIVRCGLLQAPSDQDWRSRATRGVARAFGVVVVAAIVCAVLDGYAIPLLNAVFGTSTGGT